MGSQVNLSDSKLNPTAKGSKTKKLILTIISLFFIFVFGRICPLWASVTREGVKALGLFIGVIMLASSGHGLIAPFCIGCFAIVFNGLATGSQLLSNTLGGPLVWPMMLVFALFYGILSSGAGEVLAKKMICSKIANGRPTVFIFIFFLAMAIGSALLSSTNMCIFGFAILASIRDELGYHEDSRWFKAMLFGTYFSIIFGACMLPFKDMQMSVWANATAAMTKAGVEQNYPIFILAILLVFFIFIILYTIAMKTILRVDVSKLQSIDASKLETLKDTTFTKTQKILLTFGIIAMVYPVVVPMLPKTIPVVKFLSSIGNNQWYMLILFIMCLIKVDGKNIYSIERCFKEGIRWPICCALMIFMYAGTLLSTAEWGVRDWLVSIFTPIFGNVPFPLFVFFCSLVTVIITNLFSNNATAVILGVLTTPFMLKFVESASVNPYVYGPMITMSAMFAWATMASGPTSPLLIGEGCMMRDTKFLYRTGFSLSIAFVIINTVVITVLAYVL